jgi:predicted Zn-dependent protease
LGDTPRPDVEIELMPGARDAATDFLRGHPGLQERLDRVSRPISGFETPYGMELLSSVHWAATHAENPAVDEDSAIRFVAVWNDRKRRMFQPVHIGVAWDRLLKEEWVASA